MGVDTDNLAEVEATLPVTAEPLETLYRSMFQLSLNT